MRPACKVAPQGSRRIGRIIAMASATRVVRLGLVLALVGFVAYSVASLYWFYGEWLVRYPLFALVVLMLVAILYGRLGQGFGLVNLFLHENRNWQIRAGFYVGLLMLLQWAIAFEIVRDLNNDGSFEDLRNFRNSVLWENTGAQESLRKRYT